MEKGGVLPPFSLPVIGNVAHFETDFDTAAIRHGCTNRGASVRAGDSLEIE